MPEITKQTYAESRGEKPFDWNAALANPAKLTLDDRMNRLSSRWVSCACGAQCEAIPRHSNGSPCDDLLREHGSDFYNHIVSRRWTEARETLAAIEQRSAELIAEMAAYKAALFRKMEELERAGLRSRGKVQRIKEQIERAEMEVAK